jgi:hypothetical protein
MGLKHLIEKIEPHFTHGGKLKNTTRCMKRRRPFSTRRAR